MSEWRGWSLFVTLIPYFSTVRWITCNNDYNYYIELIFNIDHWTGLAKYWVCTIERSVVHCRATTVNTTQIIEYLLCTKMMMTNSGCNKPSYWLMVFVCLDCFVLPWFYLPHFTSASSQHFSYCLRRAITVSKNSVMLVISLNGEKLNLAFFSKLSHLRCDLPPHGDDMPMNGNSTKNDWFDGRFM